MFEALSERLTGVFDRLSGRGLLSEKDVDEALREVRVALLEADVALPVARDFIAKARERATGEAVVRSVRPADQVVKIIYDGLVETLGGDEAVPLNLAATPPVVILIAGLQGSGKTTLAAKLGLRLSKTDRKRVLMASLDTRRPAAMAPLAQLGVRAEVETLPIVAGQSAADIARRALSAARPADQVPRLRREDRRARRVRRPPRRRPHPRSGRRRGAGRKGHGRGRPGPG